MSRDIMNPDCKVYVGNLGSSASKDKLEHEFQKFGPLKNVWVARNPPGFAFIEFEEARDVSIKLTRAKMMNFGLIIDTFCASFSY
jgi:RNA recognition motif-containing protein